MHYGPGRKRGIKNYIMGERKKRKKGERGKREKREEKRERERERERERKQHREGQESTEDRNEFGSTGKDRKVQEMTGKYWEEQG